MGFPGGPQKDKGVKDEVESRQGPSGHARKFGLHPRSDEKSLRGLKVEGALWGRRGWRQGGCGRAQNDNVNKTANRRGVVGTYRPR